METLRFSSWTAFLAASIIHQGMLPSLSDISFSSHKVALEETANSVITVSANHPFENFTLIATSTSPDVADVSPDPLVFTPACGNCSNFKANFTLYGESLGHTKIFLLSFHNDDIDFKEPLSRSNEFVTVSVYRPDGDENTVLLLALLSLVLIHNLYLGLSIDWTNFWENVKQGGPINGIVLHLIIMPIVWIIISDIQFPEQPALRLGILFVACTPGGMASNFWTRAFGGDVQLSMTMTAVNTIVSLVALPLWTFAADVVVLEEKALQIHYFKILSLSFGLLATLLLGYGTRLLIPKSINNLLSKILKIYLATLIIWICVYGTLVNIHLSAFMDWKLFLVAICIPLTGMVLSFLIVLPQRQKLSATTAVSLEAALPNVALTYLLLAVGLDAPESQISIVCPMAVALMSQNTMAVLCVICKLSRGNPGAENGETDQIGLNSADDDLSDNDTL